MISYKILPLTFFPLALSTRAEIQSKVLDVLSIYYQMSKKASLCSEMNVN